VPSFQFSFGGVILDQNGNLLGADEEGYQNYGALYRLKHTSTGGSISFPHVFNPLTVGGARPNTTLVGDEAGNFCGTTIFGGEMGTGTVYKLTADGRLQFALQLP
jgi:uncharacterized repeat protein (TIGR03803 family)